jgi:3-hydroxyacyl-[acyl-carrier-protein] dehydratase
VSSTLGSSAAVSRWNTLDRILSLEEGEGKAYRNVPNTLAIFDSHFPRFPVLPGVLILGSLGELGRELLREQTGKTWRLVGGDQIRYRHFVQPGDRLDLAVKVKDLSDDEAVLTGDASVEGRVVTQARKLRFRPSNV